MSSLIRAIVWLGVVAASVAVGVYVSKAPSTDNAAPAPASPGTYLFVAGGADPYWQLCIAGAKDAATKVGAELDVLTPDDESEAGLVQQLEWLAAVDTQKYDGVAVGPIDPTRTTTLINSLSEKVHVVTVDSDVPESKRLFYIGSSNYEAGMLASQAVKQALPEGGKVAVLLASRSKTNADERMQGFEDDLSTGDEGSAKWQIADVYLDQGDMKLCVDNIRKAVADHADLSAIVGTFGYHAPLILETLSDTEGGEQLRVVAFDEDERTLAGVKDGRVHTTIVQDPFMFGSEAVHMLEQVRSGRYSSLPVAGRVDVGIHCVAIDAAKLTEFQQKLVDRLGENAAQ